MIDQMINQMQVLSETVNLQDTASQPVAPVMKHHYSVGLRHLPSHLNSMSDEVISDITDKTKTRGFLSHNSTSFFFIGPDRDPSTMLEIKDYVHAAQIIKETKLPNYRYARHPIKYNLKLDTWHHHLQDYLNQLCKEMQPWALLKR